MLRRALLSVVLAAALSTSAASSIAEPSYRLTLTGGTPEGLWSMLSAGINNALREDYKDSIVTYQTSGGGLANVAIVSDGRAELGLVHNVEMKVAMDGTEPFKAPMTRLRVIAVLYDWAPMQMVVTKSFKERHGIESFADLAVKKPPMRIAVNQRGNMVQEMNKQILAAHGVSYEDIASWGGQVIYAPGPEMANLFSDRRIDMAGNGVFVPDRNFARASQSVQLDILALDPKAIPEVAGITGADPYVIPKGSYEWLDRDVPTVALSALLVASEAMPDETAYNLTKALVTNVNRIQQVHNSMAALTPELMASMKIAPYHPGAEKYYREAGLMR